MDNARRLGVLGGTFDPIHLGHLIIAEELADALALDHVLFVPSGHPPHKTGLVISPDADRLAMLERAIAGNPRFGISTLDLDRPGPSYTADLLELVQMEWPDATLTFLMGADSLRDLPRWHAPERILALAALGVATRPDIAIDLAASEAALPALRERVQLVETTLIGIASHTLRAKIAAGQSVRYQLPAAVEAYIREHRLYVEEGTGAYELRRAAAPRTGSTGPNMAY